MTENVQSVNVLEVDPRAPIPRSASFADLFEALHECFLHTGEEGVWRAFDDGLEEYFSKELRDDVIELELIGPEKASEIIVLELFEMHGDNEHEVAVHLPIDWVDN